MVTGKERRQGFLFCFPPYSRINPTEILAWFYPASTERPVLAKEGSGSALAQRGAEGKETQGKAAVHGTARVTQGEDTRSGGRVV